MVVWVTRAHGERVAPDVVQVMVDELIGVEVVESLGVATKTQRRQEVLVACQRLP